MGGQLIEEDLFVRHSIVDKNTPQGQVIHDFLLGRVKRLAGKIIDFKKNPIAFVISDSEEPNAFFAPVTDPMRAKYDEYRNIKNTIHAYDIPIICVTKGLIDLVDNVDQLDYVLGHELTHSILRRYGIEHNSKGEEELADLHAVDLVYDAGSDPKEALKIERKLQAYAQNHKDEIRRRDRYDSDQHETGVDWSKILDVHMTGSNRESALKASLTRLSHLIDGRTPSGFDKSIFAVEYSDPVDKFLKDSGYNSKTSFEKLKILVDCVDRVSTHVPAEKYLQDLIDSLPKKVLEKTDDAFDFNYNLEQRRERYQEIIAQGYKDYFKGGTIAKKYQQKIAWLAEDVIKEIREDDQAKYDDKGTAAKATNIAAAGLDIYLQNEAYKHVKRHSYPRRGEVNYFDASGIMYTYFHTLLHEKFLGRRHSSNKKEKNQLLPQVNADINEARSKIYAATGIKDFRGAAGKFDRLLKMHRNIQSSSFGDGDDKFDKLHNLSFVGGHSRDHHDSVELCPEFEAGHKAPWTNLLEIARADEKSRKYIVKFLKDHLIHDFRITHDQPYVKQGYSHFSLSEDGKIRRRAEKYEVDYATDKDTVLNVYAYIRDYFDQEKASFDKVAGDIENLSAEDFSAPRTRQDDFNTNNLAEQKISAFMALYNSLPRIRYDEENARWDRDNYDVRHFISKRYFAENKMPGLDEEGKLRIDGKLLYFRNPIFEKHFGKDFAEKISREKQEQNQKMFDAAFAAIQHGVDLWMDTASQKSKAEAQREILREEMGGFRRDNRNEKKEEEFHSIQAEVSRTSAIKDSIDSLLYNFTFSVFKSDEGRWTLNRLTPEQSHILADYVVKDEKGAFLKLFRHETYATFCNFKEILLHQTNNVISGNYELTEAMKIVAGNIGYTVADSREDLKKFLNENDESKYSASKYMWYLHVFDTMRYLEKSSAIDIKELCRALENIEITDSSRNSGNHELLEAAQNNYIKFVKESKLIDLVSKAVNFQGNYKDLSFDETLETADALAALKKQMTELLGEKAYNYYGDSKKVAFSSEHKKFISLINKNIENLLMAAQSQALQQGHALTKITDLYRLYAGGGANRMDSLNSIIENKKSLERVFDLSKDKNFWPEDVLEHAKAFVFAKNTFLDNIEFENEVLNNIFDKLNSLPPGRKKNECFFILLDKNFRASYPETRERLFDIYTRDITRKIGQDDCSEKYQRRLAIYLKTLAADTEKEWDIGKQHGNGHYGLLSNSISSADKYLLLRQISNAIISQEQTSSMLKKACAIKLDSYDMLKSYLYGIGVDYLTEKMDTDPESANKFIRFLNSRGEARDCEDMSAFIKATAKKDCEKGIYRRGLDEALKNAQPVNCKILYENFWSAPLEARSVIIARMLKSAVNTKNDDKSYDSWERVFDIVMDNLISPDDASIESKYARDIMHSYIKARSDYERELILSAMMVASRSIGRDAGNVGKALKLFLENMGPAEIKLGQAVSSHPDTPENIKIELQDLKNAADMPARWSLYDWIRAENIPDELWKHKYLGIILGSASYYTSVELGDSEVLRILRPEAREKAEKGFKVIAAMVDDLKAKDTSSSLDYKQLTSSVSEMINQASRMSSIETDHDTGEKQYKYARDIYNGAIINSGKEAFSLKLMDWRARGKNWIVMDKAKGFLFNDLPEATPEQKAYKKAFAKAYVAFEVMNIISGGKFDHDRHGAQLRIDPNSNKVGIFDTGAMALENPGVEQQKLFGNVIYDLIKKSINEQASFADLGSLISRKVEELHKQGIDTQYLVEIQKGLLALGDFFKVLDENDIKDIFSGMNIYSSFSDHIKTGMLEKMSLVEKLQLKVLLAAKPAHKSKPAFISKAEKPGKVSHVANFNFSPTIQSKSNWFQDLFANPDDEGKNQSIDPDCLIPMRGASQTFGHFAI